MNMNTVKEKYVDLISYLKTKLSRSGLASGQLLGALSIFAIIVLCVGGWLANIVKLVALIGDPLTSEVFIRLAGIPIVPLGIVSGYF